MKSDEKKIYLVIEEGFCIASFVYCKFRKLTGFPIFLAFFGTTVEFWGGLFTCDV